MDDQMEAGASTAVKDALNVGESKVDPADVSEPGATNSNTASETNLLTDSGWMKSFGTGLLENYRPAIEKEVCRTHELVRSQQVLLDTLHQEKTRLEEYAIMDQVNNFFSDLKLYHGKLVNMKKDMAMIDEKVNRMVKVTNRLRIIRQKEDMYKAQQEDKKLVLEKEITAKPVVLEENT